MRRRQRLIGLVPTAVMMVAMATVGAARAADGAAVFTRNCAFCHQSNAAGVSGQFPRLAGRLGKISSKAQGRAYLIDVITYGMTGPITVDRQPIIGGVMPSLHLSNDDAANVLSYLASLGDTVTRPFTIEELVNQRAKPQMTSADVYAERRSLQASKLLE